MDRLQRDSGNALSNLRDRANTLTINIAHVHPTSKGDIAGAPWQARRRRPGIAPATADSILECLGRLKGRSPHGQWRFVKCP